MPLAHKAQIHLIMNIIIIVIITLTISSCDPGIFYKPKGWQEKSPLWWSTHFGPVEIAVSNMGGLVGDTVTGTDMLLKNNSDIMTITLKSVVLKTKSASTAAIFNAPPLSPGEVKTVSLLWRVKEPLYKVLIQPMELQIVILLGMEESILHVPIIRQ